MCPRLASWEVEDVGQIPLAGLECEHLTSLLCRLERSGGENMNTSALGAAF